MQLTARHFHSQIFRGVTLIALTTCAIDAAEEVQPLHHMGIQPPSAPSAEPPNTQFPPGTIGTGWPKPVEDDQWFGSLLVDELEYQLRDGTDNVRWDVVGWYGGDYDRLWIKTEGDWQVEDVRGGNAEAQALYGRLIAPYWDVQVGVRYDLVSTEGHNQSRGFGVLGLQGLAPYWFEVEPAFFVSEDGDVSGRVTVSYDLLLTQRLILQPRFDLDAAVQAVPQYQVGQGVNSIALGLRLRYEIYRELAPYIGLVWQNSYGETADLERSAGEQSEQVAGVVGVRIWL